MTNPISIKDSDSRLKKPMFTKLDKTFDFFWSHMLTFLLKMCPFHGTTLSVLFTNIMETLCNIYSLINH